jgi:hypothetical protein
MKPTGKDGFLYSITFGAAIVGDGTIKVTEAGFYRIQSKAATGSGIPENDTDIKGGEALAPGNIYWAKKDQNLAVGDTLIPLTIKRISFTTDVTASAAGQSYDISTQEDVPTGTRAYAAGAFKERTGTINGMVDVDSDEQRVLVNEFSGVITDDGTAVTVKNSSTGEHDFMMSRRETTNVGETEMWEYLPVVVEQINWDKPMDGVQPFNFNYRVDGSRKPFVYYRTIV